MRLEDRLQKKHSPSRYHRLDSAARTLLKWWWRNDLVRLALLFHTDKRGSHSYMQHYERFFRGLKDKKINLLEIGVGGFEHSDIGGESLRMWKAYFRKGRIVGIDIHDKTQFREHRIDIRQCDQTDSKVLQVLSGEYGGFDIVIDDGSHINEQVIKTFQILFPLMRSNGIYVIEDVQTSYWPTWGGGIDNPVSTMEFFKSLADGVNFAEYPIENFKPDYFDQNIIEIAFIHNLIFIRKGNNNEKTNSPEMIQRELPATSKIGNPRS